VHTGDVEVVALHRHRSQDRLDESRPSIPSPPLGQLNPDGQLGRRDRGDRDVVVIADQRVEPIETEPVGVDQDRGVEDQPRQWSVDGPTLLRRARNSSAHSGSRPRSRNALFNARPVPPAAGPIVATTRPRRTTTNVSPSDSTLSRSSEKPRAAAVALICFI
jgi:hypothetical protein